MNNNKPWIQTYTGKAVHVFNPTIDEIDIDDIAHSLSMQTRFTGHVKQWYSTAEHSIRVAQMLIQEQRSDLALWGLLHDASEAYLVDLPSPLKRSEQLSNFKTIENKVMQVICEKFNLIWPEPAEVKKQDIKMFVIESLSFMTPLHKDFILPYTTNERITVTLNQQEAKNEFLRLFYELNTKF